MSIKAYKGFNADMTCRGFQYEEGKEYSTDKAVEALSRNVDNAAGTGAFLLTNPPLKPFALAPSGAGQ